MKLSVHNLRLTTVMTDTFTKWTSKPIYIPSLGYSVVLIVTHSPDNQMAWDGGFEMFNNKNKQPAFHAYSANAGTLIHHFTELLIQVELMMQVEHKSVSIEQLMKHVLMLDKEPV